MSIELNVYGRRHRVDVDSAETLLSVLREELSLTGSKYGCGEGQCGACTVLLDGRAVRSCQTPVAKATSAQITTIEGLERDGRLHPLQQAFIEETAMQCGYCTAGMIMAGAALLESNAHPSEADIVRAMNGNVCRCGTYPQIVAAIQRASREMHATPASERRHQEKQQEKRP
jgi:aerobic-type carbon monoxide dehydrogenase small subunit (CoxS/CutS family)